MLKAVAGAAANDPNILRFRVAIQDEIVVCGVFILTYPVLQQRGVSHRWKARAQIGTCRYQFFLRNLALHRARINYGSAGVVSDLEAAPVVSRDTKERSFASINPGRQLRFREAQVARGCAEEEDFLTSGSDRGRQEREDFPKPWTKGKNIMVSIQDLTRVNADSLHAMGHD